MTNPQFPCRVCGQKAHGNHFGVFSCRACAAFFRRTATSKWVHKKCRNGYKEKTCICKACRLKRCLEAGMRTEKFQYNRDAILHAETSITPSISYFVGRPEFLLFCDPETPTYSRFNTKMIIDVSHLISEASRLLDIGNSTPYMAENQLKKLTLGFDQIKLDTENVKFYGKIGQTEFMDIIEYYFVKVSKWIMNFDEFQKLGKTVQIKILQAIWHVWSKIHKCSSTAMYRKSQQGARKMHKIIRNTVMDREKAKMDLSWMSDYPEEYVIRYMFSHNCQDFEIMEAIENLDPSDVELTFMFAQLCFEYAGKRFQGEILKITDRFQQILTNDLHDYYVKDQRRPRYFGRLNEIMKVNNLVQKSIWKSRTNSELGRVFDVVRIGYSHPEMFVDSGFY
ncbi:unnamed protein product [Caenorhabditis nigoni]